MGESISNHFKPLIFGVIILIGYFGQGTRGDKVSPIVVDTENGPVQGITKSSRSETCFTAFIGLRYANPVKRFEPSELLQETWKDSRVADTPGNICAQPSFTEVANIEEDCLFLNVYVPQKQLEDEGGTKLPVMIWVHGGGFLTGDGFSSGPDYFMDDGGVVLITLNYRLGIFGFIATEDNVLSPNNGLRDVVTALKWVQKNVASFKGDPNQVTMIGESAGSAVIHYLLMSPEAEGLYHKAVLQSGAFSPWGYDINPSESAVQVAKYLKCDSENGKKELSSIEIRKCLEEKTAGELEAAQQEFMPRWPVPYLISRFLPTAEVAEDKFFYDRPGSIIGKRSKYAKPVPVIIGGTKDEGAIFASLILSNESNVPYLNENWDKIAANALYMDTHFSPEDLPEVARKIREFYFGSKPVSFETKEELADMFSDGLMILPIFLAAKEMAKEGFTVYPYIFAYEGISGLLKDIGLFEFPGMVCHGDDLMYMFPRIFGKDLTPDSDDEKFSQRFVALLKSFAIKGTPSSEWGCNEEAFDWKPLQIDDQESKDVRKINFDVLWMDKEPHITKIDFTDRAHFWMDLMQDYGLISRKEGTKHSLKSEL